MEELVVAPGSLGLVLIKTHKIQAMENSGPASVPFCRKFWYRDHKALNCELRWLVRVEWSSLRFIFYVTLPWGSSLFRGPTEKQGEITEDQGLSLKPWPINSLGPEKLVRCTVSQLPLPFPHSIKRPEKVVLLVCHPIQLANMFLKLWSNIIV